MNDTVKHFIYWATSFGADAALVGAGYVWFGEGWALLVASLCLAAEATIIRKKYLD